MNFIVMKNKEENIMDILRNLNLDTSLLKIIYVFNSFGY